MYNEVCVGVVKKAIANQHTRVQDLQIQSLIQDGPKYKKVLVESEKSKHTENINSPPEDVRNSKLQIFNKN